MRILRDGYWRDLLVHLCLVVLAGSFGAWAVAWGADAVFGDAVSRLVGEVGEYDVMVQVRSEHKEAAASDIAAVVERNWPGARVNDGVSLAGQTYYFIKVPDGYRTAETFTGVGALFESVTGFVGYSLMVEPSVVVSGLHEALWSETQALAESLPDVAFTFRNGSSLVAVLKNAEGVARVQHALEEFLRSRDIVEIRLPLGGTLAGAPQTAATVEAALVDAWGQAAVHAVHFALGDPETENLVATLRELRRFLVGYATQITFAGGPEYAGRRILVAPATDDGRGYVEVQVEEAGDGGAWGFVLAGETAGRTGPWYAYERQPDGTPGRLIGPAAMRNERGELAATLEESVRLLRNLADFAATAQDGMAQAEAAVAAFDEAVTQLERIESQMQQLAQALAGQADGGETTPAQALLAVLVNGWLNRLSGVPASPAEEVGGALLSVDLKAVRATLAAVAEGVTDLAALDAATVIAQIEQMQRTLPLLSDEEIARSVRLIDQNLGETALTGERITAVTEAGVALAAAEKALNAALGTSGVRLVRTVGGVIAPNARTALAQILGQVRELVAALCAAVIVLLVLFCDYSLLLSMERLLRSARRDGRRQEPALLAAGGLAGAGLLAAIALLSGGRLPLVGWPGLVVAGAAMGSVTAALAPRINPVDADEVVAGEALGLDHRRIMREIVVPSARPGLLVWLNRRQQYFR